MHNIKIYKKLNFELQKGKVGKMKKMVLFFCVTCYTLLLHAQEVKMDKELSALVDIVKLLRSENESNYNKAVRLLETDAKWTSMCETGEKKDTEFSPSNKTQSFKLNRAMNAATSKRKIIIAKGEMLSGEDSRFNYSLIERFLKKNNSASYTLRKREGRQIFVFVPLSKKKGSLTVSVKGKSPSIRESSDGIVTCSFDNKEEDVVLTVTNRSGDKMPFVIINHNSRK